MACLTALISGQTSSLQFQFHIWQNTLRCLAKYLFICGSFLCFQGVINMNFENLFMEDCSRWEISWKKLNFSTKKRKTVNVLEDFLRSTEIIVCLFFVRKFIKFHKKVYSVIIIIIVCISKTIRKSAKACIGMIYLV